MDNQKERLIRCFAAVFPGLKETEIATATQASVPAWDSLAAVTLINVIEDEFGIQIDLDRAAEIDSFEHTLALLQEVTEKV